MANVLPKIPETTQVSGILAAQAPLEPGLPAFSQGTQVHDTPQRLQQELKQLREQVGELQTQVAGLQESGVFLYLFLWHWNSQLTN